MFRRNPIGNNRRISFKSNGDSNTFFSGKKNLILAVEILATNEGKLNCDECDEKLREERGHDKEGSVPFMVDGKRVFRCPLTFITNLTWEYIKAYGFYRKSLLPNGNLWTEESERYIEAMMILDNEFNDLKDRGSKPK